MIKARLFATVPLILVNIFLLWLDLKFGTGWGLATSMVFFIGFALREFYNMARARGDSPYSFFAICMSALLIFGHERWCLEKYHEGYQRLTPDLMSMLVAFTILGCFLMPVLKRNPKGSMGDIGSTLLGFFYIWGLSSFIMRVRHLGMPNGNGWQIDGIEMVMVGIFIAKLSDVGGLVIGSKFGKHKLCPTLSPKKSWEGLFGGISFSVIAICIVAKCEPYGAIAALGSWWKIIGLGVVLALTSLLGDLIESSFKRDVEVKDAGKSVPGFGGFLDVIDSLLISAPAMYYYMIVIGGAKPGLEWAYRGLL